MKKILFVYHTSSIGGGSYCLLNILKSLDRCVFDPVVLLRNNGPLVDELRALNINVLYLKDLRTVPYNSPIYYPANFLSIIKVIHSRHKYKKIIRQLRPDILYVNSMMLYPYLLFAQGTGIKSLIHIREHWPEDEHIIQRKFALRSITKHANKIVAINRFSASMFSQFQLEIPIVYDWIDMSGRLGTVALDQIFGEDISSKRIYLYLGGLQKIKGALEVVKTFSKHINNSDARLLVLGVDPDYKSKGFKQFVKLFLSGMGLKPYSQKVIDIIKGDDRIRCMPGTYEIGDLFVKSYCIMSYFTIPHANLALAESIICNAINVAAMNEESLEYSLEGELAILYEANNINSFENALDSLDNKRDEILLRIREKSSQLQSIFAPDRNINLLNSVLLSISNE